MKNSLSCVIFIAFSERYSQHIYCFQRNFQSVARHFQCFEIDLESKHFFSFGTGKAAENIMSPQPHSKTSLVLEHYENCGSSSSQRKQTFTISSPCVSFDDNYFEASPGSPHYQCSDFFIRYTLKIYVMADAMRHSARVQPCGGRTVKRRHGMNLFGVSEFNSRTMSRELTDKRLFFLDTMMY